MECVIGDVIGSNALLEESDKGHNLEHTLKVQDIGSKKNNNMYGKENSNVEHVRND